MSVSFDFKNRLGSGYFGEVWHAIDTGLMAECALKCIPKDKVINQGNFFQEAQTLKASEHANIVKVNDTGILSDGRIFVSMEFLRRGSLEDEARGGLLKLSRSKQLLIDILRGLQYAHSQGIVHRDIKPANILIGNGGEGKLSDFGLALPDFSSLSLPAIKQYQYILHLAPEVTNFTDYTKLSDIYSCGVTFYRMINGDNYLPTTDPSLARALTLQGKFPNRENYRPFIPKKIRDVINKAMQMDPSNRYQSAEEMRRAIESLVVHIDWSEDLINGGMRWRGVCDDKAREIHLFEDSKTKKWNIEERNGKDFSCLRLSNPQSASGLEFVVAKKAAAKRLQNIVNGRI